MTIDRARVEEGARLAAEATPGWKRLRWRGLPPKADLHIVRIGTYDAVVPEADAAFIAHWNPEFAAELARELQRLWRVEEAAREALEFLDFLADGRMYEGDRPLGLGVRQQLLRALANPAAEEGE